MSFFFFFNFFIPEVSHTSWQFSPRNLTRISRSEKNKILAICCFTIYCFFFCATKTLTVSIFDMHLFSEKKLSIFSFPRSLTKSVRWLFHERALSAKPRMLDSCSTRVTARQNKKVKHAAKLLHRNKSLWYWILYSHLINLLHDVTSVLIVKIWNLAQQIPLRFNKQLNKYIPILR